MVLFLVDGRYQEQSEVDSDSFCGILKLLYLIKGTIFVCLINGSGFLNKIISRQKFNGNYVLFNVGGYEMNVIIAVAGS